MLSFDRRSVLILPAILAACGFTPVYAPNQSGSKLQSKVLVAELEGLEGYLLVRDLERQLGRADVPDYALDLTLRTAVEGLGVTPTGNITRYSVLGSVDYRLRPIGTETPIASGQVNNFTGYSATGTTVETLAAERDARARLMAILANQITTELYSTVDLPE